jgi:hypothetical protein
VHIFVPSWGHRPTGELAVIFFVDKLTVRIPRGRCNPKVLTRRLRKRQGTGRSTREGGEGEDGSPFASSTPLQNLKDRH